MYTDNYKNKLATVLTFTKANKGYGKNGKFPRSSGRIYFNILSFKPFNPSVPHPFNSEDCYHCSSVCFLSLFLWPDSNRHGVTYKYITMASPTAGYNFFTLPSDSWHLLSHIVLV